MRNVRWLGPVALLLSSALLSACSAGSGLPQSPLLAGLERKSGLIAFVGTDGNIYTIDQAGRNRQAITADAESGVKRYDVPAWSPADQALAFVGINTPTGGAPSATLYTFDAESGELRELYSSAEHLPFFPYWSPDGQSLGFLSTPGTGSSAYLGMHLASLEGGEPTLIDTGRPYYWAWSPVERKILVHVGGSARTNPSEARLSFLTLDAPVREVALDIKPTNFQAPEYSPDGSHILLAGDTGAGRQELVLARASGEIRSTILDYEGVVAFDWAPRGDHAAYVLGADPTLPVLGELVVVDVGDPSQPIVSDFRAQQVFGFFWAPNGRKLAYFVYLPLEQAEGQGEGQSRDFALRLHITDVNTGKSKELMTFWPTPSFFNILVTFDQYQRSMTIWSPDSNQLAIPVLAGQNLQPVIAVVPASGAYEPRVLVEGLMAVWSWR